ncbi:hypothetical protein [Myxococcus sp. AM009]|uniref:hypothetical protein n=1 Tax=Myxococcus sp. AM009 TaxID=2745137 RepID=UPI0020CC8308|nr:hypothetical protein [Myxococcus sp. AM009]
MLVVLGTLASRRFGQDRLSHYLRDIMIDSPFWEEQRALERKRVEVHERVDTLLTFANARRIPQPPDVEERLSHLGAAALKALVTQAVTDPDTAATELRAILTAPQH